MTDKIELSRRKVLASLGTIGVASAGAGLGTSAYFSDVETFTNNRLVAGSLDLKVDWEEHYYNGAETDIDVVLAKNDPENVPEDYVGLPDPEAPLIAVPSEELPNFMDSTALESFPDPNNDGMPELEYEDWEYDACDHGADTPEDLDPTVEDALRTLNEDTVFGSLEEPEGVKPLVYLEDVKPGDFGEVTFSFHLCDNPGYVWTFADNVEARENGHTEPEEKDPDEEGPEDEVAQGMDILESDVELLDAIQTLWWYDPDGDNVLDEDDEGVIFRGPLRASLKALMTDNGIPLDGDRETDYDESEAFGDETNEEYGVRECFAGSDTHYIGFAWWLPVDHANEIQTDSVEFDIGFYTEQCRHNDGEGMTFGEASDAVTLTTDDSPPWITAEVDPGPTTTVTVELDDSVYGDWPDNPSSHIMEANIDISTDGLAGSDADGSTDDFRIGFGGADAATRNGTAGGYIKRNEPGAGGYFTTIEEDIEGFSATESGDQLTYTFEIDWTSDDLPETPASRSAPEPESIIVNEVFGSDGGNGVQTTNVDPTTDPSSELETGL